MRANATRRSCPPDNSCTVARPERGSRGRRRPRMESIFFSRAPASPRPRTISPSSSMLPMLHQGSSAAPASWCTYCTARLASRACSRGIAADQHPPVSRISPLVSRWMPAASTPSVVFPQTELADQAQRLTRMQRQRHAAHGTHGRGPPGPPIASARRAGTTTSRASGSARARPHAVALGARRRDGSRRDDPARPPQGERYCRLQLPAVASVPAGGEAAAGRGARAAMAPTRGCP